MIEKSEMKVNEEKSPAPGGNWTLYLMIAMWEFFLCATTTAIFYNGLNPITGNNDCRGHRNRHNGGGARHRVQRHEQKDFGVGETNHRQQDGAGQPDDGRRRQGLQPGGYPGNFKTLLVPAGFGWPYKSCFNLAARGSLVLSNSFTLLSSIDIRTHASSSRRSHVVSHPRFIRAQCY